MLLSALVATSAAVGATRSRKGKVTALAELLRSLDHEEVAPAVGFLVGVPRQGRIGVGWRTAFAVDVEAAAEPTLAVLDLDAAPQREAERLQGFMEVQPRHRLGDIAFLFPRGKLFFQHRIGKVKLGTGDLKSFVNIFGFCLRVLDRPRRGRVNGGS